MTAIGNVSEALKTVHKVPKAEAEERAMVQLTKVGLANRAGQGGLSVSVAQLSDEYGPGPFTTRSF